MNKNFFLLSLIIFFIPIFAVANEEVVLRKNAYGSLFWGGKKHNSPAVYPLLQSHKYITPDTKSSEIRPFYTISDIERDKEESTSSVKIHLSVKRVDAQVMAIVDFRNARGESVFVSRKQLPLNNHDMCDSMFLITTENIRLDYLGSYCNFGDDLGPEYWVEIPAGKNYQFAIELNKIYFFPHGGRRYNIGTLEYFLVNKSWFSRQNYQKILFSLINGGFYCEINESSSSEYDGSEEKNRKINLEDFIHRFGFYGDNTGIILRSNQVIINVNGDEITSPYDTM